MENFPVFTTLEILHEIQKVMNDVNNSEDESSGHWSLHGPGSDTKWYGTDTYKPNAQWDEVAEIVMINFRESGHPVVRGTSALE